MNKLNTLTAFLLALSLAPAATARPNRDGGGRSNSGGSAPASRPAPSYSAPSRPAPSYSPPSRPSYSPPAQNYRPSYSPPVQHNYQRSTPTFQQPSYTAPTMQRPSYSPPQQNHHQPSFSTPAYQHPGFTAPSTGHNNNPGYQRPSYTAPTPYHLENHNNTGSNNNPRYQRPSYTAPTPGNSAPTPYHLENHNNTGSNNNPGYQRPSYTAPTPGNSAPTPYHLENHNNTGSNNNPGYQRPSYTAPTPGSNNNSGYQRPANNYQHRDNSASAPSNAVPPSGYQRPSDNSGNRSTGYSAPRTNYQYPQQMNQRQGVTPYSRSQQNSGQSRDYSTVNSQRPPMDNGGRRSSMAYNPSAQVRNGFESSNRGNGRPIPSSPAMASPTSRILAPHTTTVTTTTITNTYIRNGGYNGYYSGYNGWGYGYYRYWGPRYYCLPYLSVGLYPLFYSSGYYPVYSTGIYSPLCSIVFNSGSAYQNTPTYQNGPGYNGIDQAGASELTDTLVGGPAPDENANGDNQQEQLNNQNPDADPLSYAYNAAEPVKTFQSGEKVIFQVTGVARAQDANTYVVLTPDDRSYLFHTNGQSVDGLGRGPLVTVWLSADRDGNYKLEQVKWKQENQTPGALPRLR